MHVYMLESSYSSGSWGDEGLMLPDIIGIYASANRAFAEADVPELHRRGYSPVKPRSGSVGECIAQWYLDGGTYESTISVYKIEVEE